MPNPGHIQHMGNTPYIVREPLSPKEMQDWKDEIDKMSQIDLAHMQRFSVSGHPVFDERNDGLYTYFQSQFRLMGGMTREVSKRLVWGR